MTPMQAITRRSALGILGGGLAAASISREDDRLLEDLSRRSYLFFWEHTDPNTGITRDRAPAGGNLHPEPRRWVGSIASTGFGLTALAIAETRRWAPRRDLRERVRRTLRFFADEQYHNHGWFYHWADIRNGERVWKSEVSSIDTALLLGGVLAVRQAMADDAGIVRLATKIYERMDFEWMMNGGPTLSHGWRPETGFIPHRWDRYSEHPIIYMLGIGSPGHAIAPDTWYAWQRNWNEYKGYRYLGHAPLFTHQYSHAWVDFRGRREDRPPRVDYFENSVTATQAHRQFCLDLAGEFPGYSENVWGISASDSRKGYVAWGGPPRHKRIDGTVVPCAAAGSLMFAPDICVPAVRAMRERFGDRIYGRYGFADAFHPTENWVNPDVIGIDVGITLLSAENLRSGRVWKWFMSNPEVPRALDRAGLRKT